MPAFKNFQETLKKSAAKKQHTHIPAHALSQAVETAEALLRNKDNGATCIHIDAVEKQGKQDKHDQTVLVLITDDKPFLIDSITADCTAHGFTIEGVLHHSVKIEHNKNGELEKVDVLTQPYKGEDDVLSLLIIALQGILSVEDKNKLKESLRSVTEDVSFATRDWQKMKEALKQTIQALDIQNAAPDKTLFEEYQAFLNYIHDDNFTLLGYREYSLSSSQKTTTSKIVKGSGLGLLSDEKRPVYINQARQQLPEALQQIRLEQPTLTIAKVNKRATVHRRVPMDAIAIKTYDKNGNVNGERLFIGLFTSVTYSRSIQDIPYLRHKVNQVLEQSGYRPNSHNHRALMHILEKYPRDELFQIDTDLLQQYVVSIMALQEQPKVALYVREDPFKRYVSCLVYTPREKYETDLRMKMQNILEESFHGTCEAFYTVLDDSPLARVIYRITLSDDDNDAKKHDFDAIEDKLVKAARSWPEKLRAILLNACEEEKAALDLAEKYASAFPLSYCEQAVGDEVHDDILKLEEMAETASFALNLYQDVTDDKATLNLKIYHPDDPVTLSDILPILENYGFRVIAEKPFKLKIKGDKAVWLHDFEIAFRNPDHARSVKDIKGVFEESLRAIWNQTSENDALNALTAKAQMPWRDVLILRTFIRYMRQTGIQFSPGYMMQALTEYPKIAASCVDYFYDRHDPSRPQKERENAQNKHIKKIEKLLQDVPSFDQDKILHSLLQLIGASLRTNFFQNKDYVSVKLDSSRIDILPLPKPYVEIFVYSPRVEGVHLRGGKVARGGLRWSDRHEDFRTEVLGLMKAQNVKNAVIIPVGSKGGFVVKRPPQNPDRKAMQDEAITCYKIFISGLLDITDNIVNKKVKPPKDCVRHDCDDPYLVVAADKGTATFSDIANGIAEDYNFWLGDAFASGGSAGYDHKDMGITAKGAWESVKRHFRELGLDIQRQEFDVIGIGDMGGDVFGNGMLLSPYIRLIGAFNHLHIFCDPDPDIKKSFKERERLFNEIKGWDHYNEKILSKGGRIFSRHDKELSLTPEIMKRFDLSDKKVSPQKLMNAMLKAQTDLLWFGGIGTYIKAPNESHADVGDKANDTIRVDAHEVRARVIGEGANLGVTHAGRICMALLGVKLYADFVDNSGGVNSSDLEVNIKILLQQLMQQNEMDVKTRNKLLKSMTDDIAALVLRNNDQQAQAISVVAHEASETLQLHADLITHLEKAVNLNREIEYLPNAAAIEERARNNQGLTAPEIATLVSYTKIKLFQDLLDSHIPDDPAFQSWLINYFPAKLQKKYRDQMDSHRLKREIIATQLSNTIINRMGPAYIMDQTIKTGVAACTVARAYIIIREIFSLSNLYADIEALDNKASALSQIEALSKIATFVNYGTTWFLKNFDVESLKDENLVALGKNFQKSVQHLVKNIDNLLPNSGLLFIAERQNRLKEAGFPMDIARRVAMLPILNTAFDVAHIADNEGKNIDTVAKVYFNLNEIFSFVWLRDQARERQAESQWEAETLKNLTDRLYKTQATLTRYIVSNYCDTYKKTCDKNPVQTWLKAHENATQPIIDMLGHLREHDAPDFAMLTATELRLSQLI